MATLTLRKIVKIVATGWRILMLSSISAGAPPQTPLRSLQRSPDLLAGFWGGPLAAGGRGAGRGGGKGGRKGGPQSYCWTRAPQSLATPLLCRVGDYQSGLPSRRDWNPARLKMCLVCGHAILSPSRHPAMLYHLYFMSRVQKIQIPHCRNFPKHDQCW